MIEPIICPLWVSNDKRFTSRHYHAWDRPCHLCGRRVVVSDAVKDQLDFIVGSFVVCEQCALVHAMDRATLESSEPESSEAERETCDVCETLRQQEEEASMELARCNAMTDKLGADEARRKWGHLFNARWKHKYKAHRQGRRGRE